MAAQPRSGGKTNTQPGAEPYGTSDGRAAQQETGTPARQTAQPHRGMSDQYQKQDRGTSGSYESYFAGMDRSMQQKVALTTAYFPTRGRIADMGSGSGRGTYDLACLYQALELIGVDINPISVAHSSEQYQRPNLSYVVGDISQKVFPERSLDGILNSSVFHHVTSFNNYDLGRVLTTLDNQVAQLREGGVIIIRDFVIPDGPEMVFLDLSAGDGASEGEVPKLSAAALFEVFSRDFRSSVNRAGPVPFERLESPRPGFVRYQVGLRAAAEFILRKDYRADWQTELIEEYTYLSQSEFERAFRERELRIVASMPLWNPWIVQNRFKGRFYLSTLDDEPLPYPPTNYLIVGEKVRPGAGVVLVELRQREIESPSFLSLKSYHNRASGHTYELAERPNLTLDLVPWFEESGQVFVLAKKDFPRPVINACINHPSLNHSTLSGYVTEPISAIVESPGGLFAGAEGEVVESPRGRDGHAPRGSLNEAVERILWERAGIPASEIEELGPEANYYTSPGGIDERVGSRLVKIKPWAREPYATPNYTRFTEAGTVRELDAVQVLRACKVGGMFDARLEINIYRLLRELGRPVGPWIGAPIALTSQDSVFGDSGAALQPEPRAAFEAADTASPPKFLSLRDASFAEIDCSGRAIAEARFEYVVPRAYSRNTVVALPVLKAGGRILAGVEHRDLPAVQRFTGRSRIVVAPAWRLTESIKHQFDLDGFLVAAMRREFGVTVMRSWELGGAYFATPGVTPEIVFPMAVEIEADGMAGSPLTFIELSEAARSAGLISDAHLLIAILRLAHATGEL